MKNLKERTKVKSQSFYSTFLVEENIIHVHKNLNDLNILIDYNYNKHDHIGMQINIYNNFDNPREKINLVVITLVEVYFEKCPYIMTHKLVLPFAELCLKQIDALLCSMSSKQYVQSNEQNDLTVVPPVTIPVNNNDNSLNTKSIFKLNNLSSITTINESINNKNSIKKKCDNNYSNPIVNYDYP